MERQSIWSVVKRYWETHANSAWKAQLGFEPWRYLQDAWVFMSTSGDMRIDSHKNFLARYSGNSGKFE